MPSSSKPSACRHSANPTPSSPQATTDDGTDHSIVLHVSDAWIVAEMAVAEAWCFFDHSWRSMNFSANS